MEVRCHTGLERAVANPALLGEGSLGLLTNSTGLMPDLTRNADALLASGVAVSALFGPEHGFAGSVQAGRTEGAAQDATTGLPIHETYGKSGQELDELVRHAGVDALVFDMQDIGVRYYTYIWTMFDCMRSAGHTGTRFVVLDRPNPLGGGRVTGPGLEPQQATFVGRTDIPLRHGLTVGELARVFAARLALDGTDVDLTVVPMQGWDPGLDFSHTGLPWVPPSPNIPTLDSAFAFAGTGLLEGTNVSEGRGTTKPFELFGAPYLDGRLLDFLRDRDIAGALFRGCRFTPAFSKYSGQSIPGIQVHITDREIFDPVRTGLDVLEGLRAIHPDDFRMLPWKSEGTENSEYKIDKLWGSSLLRERLESGTSLSPLRPRPGAVDGYDRGIPLYPRGVFRRSTGGAANRQDQMVTGDVG